MPLKKAISQLILALCVTGCSTVGAPRPASPQSGLNPAPGGSRPGPVMEVGPDESARPVEGELALSVVETAFEAIGTPYEWGGNDANGFDCSGLIRYSYGRFGIGLPRISGDQLREGRPVELRVEALLPGDILGFSAVPGGEAAHVGLYVGDGQFIHSSSSGVRVSNLRNPYWQRHFMAARRIVN